MRKLLLPIDTGSPQPQLYGWLDLLNSFGPLRLTAALSADLADDKCLCRATCRKLEQYCLENDIRLKIVTAAAATPPGGSDLVLVSGPSDPVRPAQPSLLVCEEAAIPAELILVYDGSAGSKAAIRQFADLFPAFTELPANLLHIQDAPGAPIPDETAIRTLGARLFPKFRVVNIQRRSVGFFEAWLGMMTNPWIIAARGTAGDHASQRRPGFAAELIRIRPMPAFAA